MSWNQDLEGPAYEIAATNAQIVRVQAGPGTGKTFALMRQVTRLLEEGQEPERILVCTLTRTAATDLVRQVSVLGADGANRVRVGTLHSYCMRVLRESSVLELTDRVPRILLPYEVRFMIEDLKHPHFGGVNGCKKRLMAFSAAWARLQSDVPGWPTDPIDRDFHQKLEAWLNFHRAMLLDEIVPTTLHYLRSNPLAPERTRFEHVVVDEYQDLNKADQVLLDQLAGEGRLVIVGDKNQSIYSFRYAHPEGIGDFNESRVGTIDYNLCECRRCPKLVVEMANSLISSNSTRWRQDLQPRKNNLDGEVHVVQWPTPEWEAKGLALFIRKIVTDKKINAGKILVLTPRKQLGYAITHELSEIGVEAKSFFSDTIMDGDPKNIEKCKGQRAFSLLTLLADRQDIVSLRCLCGYGHNALHAIEWSRLQSSCNQSGTSPIEKLRRTIGGEDNLSQIDGVIKQYQMVEDELRSLEGKHGDELVNMVFPPGSDWASGFRRIADELEDNDFDASDLKESILAAMTQPELPTEVDYVRVMSLHKAKGLTADLVVVGGCIETLIPHVDSTLPYQEQERMLEEQRRLFYVSITRTTNILILSSTITMERGSAHKMRARVGLGDATRGRTIPSRFLRELGSKCPEVVRGDDWLRKMIG
ncbi:MAG: ATP-dependent helicase [Sedimentisphaerales bacterium]